MKNLNYDMSALFQPSKAQSRSVCAENPTGEKGKGAMEIPDDKSAARDLGQGWKVKPCIPVGPGELVTLMDVKGPGIITHIWMTLEETAYRDCILRFYWDGEDTPSVEVPIGDFFCNGWGVRTNVLSIPINVNPCGGFNSYWPMPFRKSVKVTLENQRPVGLWALFYQFDYVLDDVPENTLYFHAQWRRENPVPYAKEYTILDNIKGNGKFAGVYMAWGQNNNGWWGEGELKCYIDGDTEYPTYCGTGTEDYFGGAWCFNNQKKDGYETYSAPYLGYHQLIKSDGFNGANMRHGLYRWHVLDPIFFKENLKITIQALGWRNFINSVPGKFLPLQDDLSSMAVWYQSEPHNKFPELPDREFREVI